MSDVTDTLESLLASEGWRLYTEHVKAEWGPGGYGRKVKQALTDARARNEDAAAAVDKVDYANEQIGDVIGWPRQELARLKRQEQETPESSTPRAPSLPNVAAMSRRGGL